MTSFGQKLWRVSAKNYDNLNYMSLWRRDELNKLNSLTVWRSDFRSDSRSDDLDPTIWQSQSDDLNPTISIRRSQSDDLDPTIRSDDLDPTIRWSRSDDPTYFNSPRWCSSANSRRISARGEPPLFARGEPPLSARGDRWSAIGDRQFFCQVFFKIFSKALKPSRLNSWCRLPRRSPQIKCRLHHGFGMLKVAVFSMLCWVPLCWVSLCWVSLCWVSWHPYGTPSLADKY